MHNLRFNQFSFLQQVSLPTSLMYYKFTWNQKLKFWLQIILCKHWTINIQETESKKLILSCIVIFLHSYIINRYHSEVLYILITIQLSRYNTKNGNYDPKNYLSNVFLETIDSFINYSFMLSLASHSSKRKENGKQVVTDRQTYMIWGIYHPLTQANKVNKHRSCDWKHIFAFK